jgi:membrane protease YdiL (CAAX protease family)
MTLSGGTDSRSVWRAAPARPDRRPTPEFVIVAVLAVWNILNNTAMPQPIEVPWNLAAVVLLVIVARRATGASWDDLGLARSALGGGARLGAAAAASIILAVVAAAALPPVRSFFADGRFAGVDAAELSYETLVRIPLATALSEEVAFRGVLVGVLLAWMSPLRVVVVSSALFGLWHVLPALDALETTSAMDATGSVAVTLGAVAGQVVVTGLAGAGFCWLRLRSRHIAAPTLAHWALNAVSFSIGWLIVRNGWT